MKYKKLLFCITTVLLVFCCMAFQSCGKAENAKADYKLSPEIYQNSTYSHYDRTEFEKEAEYPFLPFGYDRCVWRENHSFITNGEMSLMEDDKNKNFLYSPSVLGTVIYKKDTYEVPKSPNIENFNELMVTGLSDNAKIITDKAEIKTLVEYLQSVRDKINSSGQYDVAVYAVSDSDGGLFLLTNNLNICKDESGELYIDAFSGRTEIPEEILDIITK